MFRENYKEAMNDIKPDAAFVESVITASKKRRPPLHARYVKYAAAAAAAVVAVSGTILAMPLLNRVEQDNDGVISETTVAETAAPAANADKTAEQTSETTPAPEGGNQSSESKEKPSQNNTSQAASGSVSQGASAKTGMPDERKEPQQDTKISVAEEKPQQPESITESADGGEEVTVSGIVMAETDEEVRENKMPADMAPYKEQADVSVSSSAAQPEIADTDIPTPSGYRCASATPRGYTFVNDEGAVITVTINYGGEERAPYIEENGENIYAVFTSFGLSVTINASGASRESVEEIINSLR